MTKSTSPVLDFATVCAWIDLLDPSDVVGCVDSASNCPLANLMLEQGFHRPFVTPGDLGWDQFDEYGPRYYRETTPFERAFVETVDQPGGHKPITAAQVRSILDAMAPDFATPLTPGAREGGA